MNQRLLTTTCWILLSATCGWAAEDWPEFRGPTGQGHANLDNLPISWDTAANVAWQQEIPGKGWSSPIIQRGRIYLTTAVAMEVEGRTRQSLRGLCFACDTGEMIWNRELFQAQPAPIHKKNSHASPTPLTDGRWIYFHFGPHGTAAVDDDGNVMWKTEIAYDAKHGGGGSPILSGELLVFNCDGVQHPFVIALDKATGKERWRAVRPEIDVRSFSFATPLEINVNGQRQIVSPGSSWVCSYDPADGHEIWRVGPSERWSVIPRPVYDAGMVFATTGYEGPSALLAIRPTGSGDVTATHVQWQHTRSVPHTPSPLIVDGKIFFISDDGVASCLDVQTGKPYWRKRLGGNYSASPLHAGGLIYCQNESGQCVIFRAADTFEEVARNDLGEQSFASFAAADDALFIRTRTRLYRIENRQ